MNEDDDLEMAGNNEYDEELEVSDADSDDFRVQADIAKLNADVAAFKASMAADSSDDDDDLIDPRLALASGIPRKRKAKKPKAAGPVKRRVGGGTRSNIAELSADIKLQLSRASQAWVVENRRDEALEIVLEIIRVNAETHEAWILLSSIYEEMGAMSDYIMAKCFAAHLRPRDFHGWISCALAALADVTPGQRETNLGIAQLCYSAAIRANPKSLKARVGKANCALEAGNANVAATEYAKVLKRKPYNMAILRNMAEAAFDTRNTKKYVELARGFYEQTITYMRSGGQMDFEWSDVIIYIEMCAFMEMYAEAVLALRSLARLLIGRPDESFWDKYHDDDREWDQDEDRRREEPEYQPDRYPYGMYGPALPLDLRAKLAIYRLKLEQDEEATRHLQWLNPQDADIYQFFVDTPFVIKDLANQLFESRKVTTALEFYDLYRRLTGEPDPEILVQQGKCYLEMEDQATAEECFIAAIEIDDDNIDARYELAQMYETAQEQEEAFLLVNEALKLEQEQRLEEGEDDDGGKDTMADKARKKRRVRQKVLRDKAKARPKRAKRVYVRRMANKQQREKYEESVTNNFKEKYQRVLELRRQMASGDKEAEAEWMAAAQDLVDDFRSFKEFYPWDKYLSFMGYGSFFRENRRKKEREQEHQQQQEEEEEREGGEERGDSQIDEEATEPQETSGLAAMAERLQKSMSTLSPVFCEFGAANTIQTLHPRTATPARSPASGATSIAVSPLTNGSTSSSSTPSASRGTRKQKRPTSCANRRATPSCTSPATTPSSSTWRGRHVPCTRRTRRRAWRWRGSSCATTRRRRTATGSSARCAACASPPCRGTRAGRRRSTYSGRSRRWTGRCCRPRSPSRRWGRGTTRCLGRRARARGTRRSTWRC